MIFTLSDKIHTNIIKYRSVFEKSIKKLSTEIAAVFVKAEI